jgi:transcriptional regulator with XRE-family HTH domain
MVVKKEREKTRTAELIEEAMNAQNLSIRDVALKADTSYEHIRNILNNGKVVPSRFLLKELAKILKLDWKELERAEVSDRIRLKFGPAALEIQGQNPELEPIERVWLKLSEEHKADIIAMVQTFAKRDSKVSN